MAGKVIVDRGVMIPMRDGVRLAADIYRADDAERHAVLLHGAPYSRNNATVVGGCLFNLETFVSTRNIMTSGLA